MERRPISQQIRQWLLGELEAWRAGGILADDQPGRILDLYETSQDAAGRRRSLAMFALSSVAALMIGLAALLVVSHNWQALSAGQKLAVIFGALLGLHATGLGLRYGGRWRLSSEMVLFVACMLYGSAIWLIAQIFHIQSHYPDGLWFWALGVLPFALCLDTLLLHALYAGLLALWVGTEILGFHNAGFWGSMFLRGCAATLPLMTLPGLVWAYRKRSVMTVSLYAPLLAWWAVLQPVAWRWEISPIYFVGLAGALLLMIAEMHHRQSPLAKPYRLYGVLITGGVLVPLSFADQIFELLRHSPAADDYVAGWVITLIGALAALAVVVLQQREEVTRVAGNSRESTAPIELRHYSVNFASILRRQWLPLCIVLLLAGLCFWNGLLNVDDPQHSVYGREYSFVDMKWTPAVLLPVTAVNVAMIVLALWLMRLGLREDRTLPFTAGVLYFLLWTVLRYADLFAGVGGMLGAAVLFLLCGVGLLVVARFWVRRKESLDTHHETPLHCNGGGLTEHAASDIHHRGRIVMPAGVGLQLVVLVGMIVLKAMPLWTGETILLRVVPIDPRDMFRGDYVALGYDFSRIPPEGTPELGKPRYDRHGDWQGKTVFVVLTPEEDGKHWRTSRITTQQPAGDTHQKYLRGTIADWNRIQCGIESYYVQEGEGMKYEEAARERKLSAEVAVTPDGRAALRGLKIESPLATAGPTYDRPGNVRWPSNATYRVRRLPRANVKIDGRLDEPEWSRANVERHFVFPWKKADAPATEFMAFCDDEHLYFAFRMEDADIVMLDKLRDKQDVGFEDRAEMFLCRDPQMKDYFGFEIDPRGRVLDYRASYYRQYDRKWNCPGLETAGRVGQVANLSGAEQVANLSGYVVEGRIPLNTLVEMGFPRLVPGVKILCGLYRAEFSHDRSGKPAVQHESIHHPGRKLDGPLPIEEWISWVDPRTPEPDFHVPSSLGWLEIVE